MRKLDGGVWEAVSAYAKEGQAYKYCVQGRFGRTVYKTDPYGNRCCALPEISCFLPTMISAMPTVMPMVCAAPMRSIRMRI